MSSSSLSQRTRPKRSIWQQIWIKRWCYLIILPGMAYFLLFKYVPMYGIQLAFKEFNIAEGISASPWVGWANFELLFRDREFFLALKNTLIISYMQLLLFFPFPIVLSILINEVKPMRYKRSVQTILTFPHFLSWVILSSILTNLLGNSGVVNNIIVAMGGEKVNFLMNKGIFRWLLIFSLLWKESGWNAILYMATITAIDPALYEAATIDGANRWHRIRYITWPGISTIVAATFILRIGSIMDAGYMQVLNLYNPAVYEVGDILDTYIYRITFEKAPDYGVSTAVGMFKGVVNAVLMLSAEVVSRKFNGEGLF